MKITRPTAPQKQSRVWILILILLALLLGLFLGTQGIVQSAKSAISSILNQQQNSTPTEIPILILDIDFEAYNDIVTQRNTAVSDGVFIGKTSNFVPADLTLDGETHPIQMRLQSGVTSHLGDNDKWNFELYTQDTPIHGAHRFYLIDPQDNNGLNEWGYQQTLQQAGLLATSNNFVNLFLNGDDLGLYILQEDPVYTVDGSGERPFAIVAHFDPKPLWQNIIYFDGDETAASSEPVTNINQFGWQLLDIDTFYNETAVRDKTVAAQEEKAIALLQAFQQGELGAAALFDVEKFGLFLAISDLWGATEATKIENLYFYLNPITNLLEPIGFNGNPSPQNGRIDLKTAPFNDPALQKAYVEALQIVSDPAYLDELQTNLNSDWEKQQKQISSNAGAENIWQTLTQKQLALQRSLHPQQPALAYYQIEKDGLDSYLAIEVSNLLNLPIELVGVDINGDQFLELDPAWANDSSMNDIIILPAFKENRVPTQISIPLTAVQNDELIATNLQLGARIVGTEFITFVPIRPRLQEPPNGK